MTNRIIVTILICGIIGISVVEAQTRTRRESGQYSRSKSNWRTTARPGKERAAKRRNAEQSAPNKPSPDELREQHEQRIKWILSGKPTNWLVYKLTVPYYSDKVKAIERKAAKARAFREENDIFEPRFIEKKHEWYVQLAASLQQMAEARHGMQQAMYQDPLLALIDPEQAEADFNESREVFTVLYDKPPKKSDKKEPPRR